MTSKQPTLAKATLLLLFTILFQSSFLLAQEKADKIDEAIQAYAKIEQFNGSVLVAQKGKVMLSKGYGMAEMEWNIPNTPDTKFRLASVTKQFTGMLIMQLKQEGKIKLDEKITTYLPDYRKETGDKVTVHHLLTHTSGVPNYTSAPGFFANESRNYYSVKDFSEKFCSGDLEFEPGSTFSYSNSGYFLLGAIIESVTGKTYEAVIQEKIFDLLGMKNSGYDSHSKIIHKRASGYENGLSGYSNANYLDMSLPYAAGSLYSTVEDLHLWDRALYGNKLLNEENMKLYFTPFLDDYAYGIGVFEMPIKELDKKVNVTRHSGGINGFSTLITRFIDDELVVIVLDNTNGESNNSITKTIFHILNDLPIESPRISIVKAMVQNSPDEKVETAIAFYKKVKKESPDKYNFHESQLNELGYMLMGMKKLEDAIEIFKLNVEMYPEASNPYDSLGEAYMAQGNKKLAIKNYSKSFELNPENSNAMDMIKKMQSNE